MKQRTYLHHFYTPSKSALDSLFYVESTGHYWCDKSFIEDNYYKQNYCMIYVKAGKGFGCNGDEKVLACPGQLLYLDMGRPYKFYSH